LVETGKKIQIIPNEPTLNLSAKITVARRFSNGLPVLA
jgi:hypothetical protein